MTAQAFARPAQERARGKARKRPAGPSGEVGRGKRAARLLGYEEGEEHAFGWEGEEPG